MFSMLGNLGVQAENNTSVNPRVNGSNIEFTSVDNRCYLVEHATSLDGQWNHFEFLRATGPTSSVPVTVDTPECFFRIRLLEEELTNARALWAKASPDTYRMWMTREGSSAGPVAGKNLYVEIKTNHVKMAASLSDSTLLESDEIGSILLVEQWHNIIETSLSNPDADILLVWDETGAIPVRLKVETSGGVLIDMSMTIEDTFHRLLTCRLANARQRWDALGQQNYTAVYNLFCFCFYPDGNQPPTSFQVTDGTEVNHSKYIQTGNPVNIPRFTPTVADMFDRVEDLLSSDKQLRVIFDRQTGYVRELFSAERNSIFVIDGLIITGEIVDDEVTMTYSLR